MRPAPTLVPLLAVGALALSGCAGSSTDKGPGAPQGKLVDGATFTMALTTDPGNLDPMLTVISSARSVGRFLYARLVEARTDGSVTSSLAETWKADTSTATFTLRTGLTCGDGKPLTATDVAKSINFVGDPANKSPLTGVMAMPGTKATGDDTTRTVKVVSGAPDAFLLVNVGSLPIVCGDASADRKLLAKGEGSTGMFTMTEVVPNDHYTLTRRKDFTWGPGDWDPKQKGLPDKVVVKIVPNETTAANLLLSGAVNSTTVSGPDLDRLMAQKLFHADQVLPLGQLFFNQAAGRPTRDEAVRRALVQALDLGKVGKVLTNGKGKPPTSLVTIDPNPCRADTVKGNVPGFDTAAATAAMDAAGWKPGAGGIRAKDGKPLRLTVVYSTTGGSGATAAAELVQQQWKALGVDVVLKAADNNALNEALFSTGAWDVSMAPLSVGLPSQFVPFASGPAAPDGANFAHIDNAEYTAATTAAAKKPGTDGCADWKAAEVALFKHVDVVTYMNDAVPQFGRGATFMLNDGFDPTSIRMHQQ